MWLWRRDWKRAALTNFSRFQVNCWFFSVMWAGGPTSGTLWYPAWAHRGTGQWKRLCTSKDVHCLKNPIPLSGPWCPAHNASICFHWISCFKSIFADVVRGLVWADHQASRERKRVKAKKERKLSFDYRMGWWVMCHTSCLLCQLLCQLSYNDQYDTDCWLEFPELC